MRRESIVAGQCARSRWLTTQDAAIQLGISVWGVRFLARQGELGYEVTRGGQFLFTLADVQRCLVARAAARNRPRMAQLQAVRVTMLKAGPEPRQLALFPRRSRLRLVSSTSESALPDRGAKAGDSGAESRASDKRSLVNRKVIGG